jgi:nucleoid DNA-binding protein
MKMTQEEFFRKIAEKAGISYKDGELVMNAFVTLVEQCVQDREPFTILNFGSLEFGKFKARRVRGNPNFLDGKDKEYPETEKLFFHISSNLKKLMKSTKK